MPEHANSNLTPAQITARKRLEKKAALLCLEENPNDSESPDVTVDASKNDRPQHKAKAKANEEKVWTRGSRKRAPTATELEQPRPKEARNQNESSLATSVEGTGRAGGRGSRKQATETPGSGRGPHTKTGSQKAVRGLKSSIGTIEDSDDAASTSDEKEGSSGPTSDQDEEPESDDEILQSLSSDPKKLQEAIMKEKPGTGKMEARRELERPYFAPEFQGKGKPKRPTSKFKTQPLGSSRWPPRTDIFTEVDGSVSLKSQLPHMIPLLHSSINLFLKAIVFENAFPEYEERCKMAIKALLDAAQKHNEQDIGRRLRFDSAYAGSMATVPEGRLAMYRRNIKKTAQPLVIVNYGLKKGCSDLITQLLYNDNFIYPQNVKGDLIRSKPFCHPAIIDTLRAVVFNGPSSLGVQFRDEFVSILDEADDPELPCNMVSLIGTAVYSVLIDWRGSNGPVDPEKVSFPPNVHISIHRRLEALQKRIFQGHRGPQKYHVVMSRLYREASGSTADSTTETTELSAFDHLDFDGMPEN
ncbi:hypothetical protein HYDPIDRAFT_29253 [Hydnomerulius pinastri MD-312]|uniref:DUF6532 domain-containing protein n=1 Tax=Hydnomerulius pinastri MD-312 TaxID=994086 RepID=A0A0C9VEB2_9AGAM|nr:hypothetical protein HYDPIDRAFT_29253 [Hydnomerulius pinastri MD-312]